MSKKRIDPKLPIPLPTEPELKPDGYQDRLRRRLDELFREFEGTLSIFDEGTYLGEADGINLIGSAVVAAQSTTLPAGIYDITVTASGGGGDTITATAVESIAAGQFVAVYDATGTPKCRIAKSSSGQGYQADGFCKDAFTVGAVATIYLPGALNIAGGTGLTAGDVWLGTDGYATNTAPTTSGYISQQIGVAENSTHVAFEPHPDILIAATHTAGTGGTTISQTFTTTTTFVVPVGAVWVTMIGGGGGGGASVAASAQAGAGGGSGEYCQNFLIPTTAGETLNITIGAKGTGGSAGSDGTDGGTTSIACLAGTFSVLGGKKGLAAGTAGAGGGPRGGAAPASTGTGNIGTAETPVHFGGGSGGNGGINASTVGGNGAGGPGRLTGGAGGTNNANGGGGGGGAASVWGTGGAGGAGNAAGSSAAATSYGAGGGGGGGNNAASQAGGDGAPGYVMLMYVA